MTRDKKFPMIGIQNGDTALITTSEWFYAPDGNSYKAVFGVVKGVFTSEDTLGVKTNAKSSNWYIVIGNMTIAGCQIHYAVKTDSYNSAPPVHESVHDGINIISNCAYSRIYNAGD